MAYQDFFVTSPASGDKRMMTQAARPRVLYLRVPAMNDATRLDGLIREEMPRVERLLLRMLGPRGDLEDLVQNVFLEASQALPRFRGESSLSTFIGAITVHVARRAMRGSWWQRHKTHLIEEGETHGPDPERAAISARHMQCIRRALERLTPKKRIAFCLWCLEGMEMAEIAQLTSSSVSATRGRVLHAQRELRAIAAKDPVLREALGEEQT